MIASNRRDFVKTCAGLAVAATVPDLRFPTDPRKRLAVASYPFRALLDAPHNSDRDRKQPGIALKDFAAMVADKFGIHNIEPLGSHFPSTDAAYLQEFRTAVEKEGSHVVNIPVDVGASFYDPDASAREKAVANGKKWVDIAAAVGSPGVRVHMQPAEGAKPDLGRASESLKSIADHSGGKGIITTLENDDLVSEDAFFLVKVIEKVNSPYLRALPDFANSMLSGDEKFNYDAVAAMFRHATNIAHVKDSEVSEGKVVRVDVGKTFGIAKAAGYRGYYSMEWEGQGGPYDGTALLIRESLKYL
jgi:sugar phosphate isomerase/epimerase